MFSAKKAVVSSLVVLLVASFSCAQNEKKGNDNLKSEDFKSEFILQYNQDSTYFVAEYEKLFLIPLNQVIDSARYYDTNQIEVISDKAILFYGVGMIKGDIDCMVKYAIHLPDIKKRRLYLTRAAALNSIEAIRELIIDYSYDYNCVKAIEYAQKGHLLSDSVSTYYLAILHTVNNGRAFGVKEFLNCNPYLDTNYALELLDYIKTKKLPEAKLFYAELLIKMVRGLKLKFCFSKLLLNTKSWRRRAILRAMMKKGYSLKRC